VPGYEATLWLGIMAPAGTPKDVVERLNSEISKSIAKPASATPGPNRAPCP